MRVRQLAEARTQQGQGRNQRHGQFQTPQRSRLDPIGSDVISTRRDFAWHQYILASNAIKFHWLFNVSNKMLMHLLTQTILTLGQDLSLPWAEIEPASGKLGTLDHWDIKGACSEAGAWPTYEEKEWLVEVLWRKITCLSCEPHFS